jgi:hypothetical protein
MTPQPSSGVLQEKIVQIGQKAEDDHKRLRGDVDAIGGKVATLMTGYTDVLVRLKTLELTPPPNVEKVAWTTKQSIGVAGAIGTACLIMSGWMYSLQSSIKDVHTDVNTAAAAVASAAKLQDERTASQKEAMGELRTALEMRRVEIQRVRDDLTEYMRQKPKEIR